VAGRLIRSLVVAALALVTLLVAPAGAAPSTILTLGDFPSGWTTAPVLPSDSSAPSTPACTALAQQQRTSLVTVGTPKFVDPRASSELDVVAATVTTMPSARAAKQQVTALLSRRLLQCLVDATNAKFASEHGGAKATTVVHTVKIPHTDAHVRAVEGKTTVDGVDRLVFTQQVVFVQEGARVATLHVETDQGADYTKLRNRLAPLIAQRLQHGDGVSV
jgi:hypothetical protein